MLSLFDLSEYIEVNESEVIPLLKACQIPTEDSKNEPRSDYTEDELNLISDYAEIILANNLQARYDELIKQKLTCQEALRKIQEECQEINVFQLIEKAKKTIGQNISLARAIEYLKLSGLKEQDTYNFPEVEKFIETCRLIILDGCSYGEVAEKNGVSQMNGVPEVGQSILEQVTKFSDQQIANWGTAVNKSMEKQQQAMAQVVTRMHLHGLAHYLGSEAMQKQADQTRQRILAQTDIEIEQLQQEYEAWENNKRQQWGLNGTNSVNALPGSMENS